MIVAGIGSRRGVGVEDILAAVAAGMGGAGLPDQVPDVLATGPTKRGEAAIFEAGQRLQREVRVIEAEFLHAAEPRLLTRSAASQAATGSPSLAEAAALAAAGPAGRLLAPRTVCGPVTCAIARDGSGQ
ncbi:cobalamin biosynthesis protein [Nitratireductor mangrovi]|uniref:Cobalamin biosynthesis protein n=2 Tax=Nitratireductor mangrovi TaxID=2599600 RepID=A0A5B8L5N6_9HYPH|nr:cobalamin biosynthesis protein [Nitratireductor mangrovi]